MPVAALLGLLTASCSQKLVSHPPPPPLSATPPAPARVAPAGTVTEGVVQIKQLLEGLQAYDRNGRNASAQSISFQLPESHINEYLAFACKTRPRPGIDGISVEILPNNRVSATVIVNFEAVAGWAATLLPDMLKTLNGRQPIRAELEFQAHDGTLMFKISTVHLPGGGLLDLQVAGAVLQYLAAHQPENYDVSRPIPLPFGLRRIWTEDHMIAGET